MPEDINIHARVTSDYPRQPIDSPGIVLIGPSGVGKSTLRERLCDMNTNVVKYCPLTTRQRRSSEIEEYVFVDEATMAGAKKSRNVLFGNQSYNNEFLTLWPSRLPNNQHYMYIYLPEAALQLKNTYINTMIVQIVPPDINVLRERILKREPSISVDQLELRIASAADEIVRGGRIADAVVTNSGTIDDTVDQLVKKLEGIICVHN